MINPFDSCKYKTSYPNLKIIIVGDCGIGKTSFLSKYFDETFETAHIATIGVDLKSKIINIDNHTFRLQVWDTAGQERFKAITTNYYRCANGVILMYDTTNRLTFLNIQKWLDEITQYCGSNIPILLIGNKNDLLDKRQVFHSDTVGIERNNLFRHIETSAKYNFNIEYGFTLLTKKIIETQETNKYKKKQLFRSLLNNDQQKNNSNNKKCC